VDRLFLDANVLFSAAYREDAGLARFWKLNVELLTSAYAVEEARVNLYDDAQRSRLAGLVSGIEVISNTSSGPLPSGVDLPEKDWPILLSAIQSRATHLITGDKADFGRYFGNTIAGIIILSPAAYLRSRRTRRLD
jgi:predicted nucleic acid-binding protein